MSTTPDMDLTLPDVSVTPGPEWASELNTALSTIDSHDHSSGKGVAIGPSGLNINADLTFNGNNGTDFRTVRLFNNPSFTGDANDLTALYALNNELYYRDGAGNILQLTSGGTINISSTIATLTIKDSTFFIENFSDLTKQMRFNVSAIPTGTTRVMSVPDSGADDTFVTAAATQSLTNKTFASNTLVSSANALRFYNSGNTFYTGFQAGANVANYAITLPISDGTNGQLLQTDGIGRWSFVTAPTTVGNVAANDSNVVFTNSSNRTQICTPTAARSYSLPTTSVVQGDSWTYVNTSSSIFITLNSSAGNFVGYVPPKGRVVVTAMVATPTAAADWMNSQQTGYGSFTPTLSGGGGVFASGSITVNPMNWSMNGNLLSFSGSVSVSGGTSAAIASFALSLPVLGGGSFPATTSATGNCTGTAGSGWFGQFSAAAGGTTLSFIAVSPAVAVSITIFYSGTYRAY